MTSSSSSMSRPHGQCSESSSSRASTGFPVRRVPDVPESPFRKPSSMQAARSLRRWSKRIRSRCCFHHPEARSRLGVGGKKKPAHLGRKLASHRHAHVHLSAERSRHCGHGATEMCRDLWILFPSCRLFPNAPDTRRPVASSNTRTSTTRPASPCGMSSSPPTRE
jgi:hypothetical protein